MLTEEADLRERFAPRVSDGCVLEASTVETSADSDVSKVDITQTEHFVAAGFDVNWCGAEENGPSLGVPGAGGGEHGGVIDPSLPVEAENEDVVKEDAFRRWLELAEMRGGVEVQRWWANIDLDEEGAISCSRLRRPGLHGGANQSRGRRRRGSPDGGKTCVCLAEQAGRADWCCERRSFC